MTTTEPSDADIVAAICDGFDTAGLLADHFGIPNSPALRTRLHAMAHDGLITTGTPGAAGTSRLHTHHR